MKGTKYLYEVLNEQELPLFIEGKNTLIISPCGSGKTHFIINQLCNDFKNILYLCDTNNLKYQVTKDFQETNYNPTFWTYHKFGSEIKYSNNSIIESFDLIICDEFHNLIDFQKMGGKGREVLVLATEYLLKTYDTKIICFTGTPEYLDKLKDKYPHADSNFHGFDFTDHPDIIQYTEKMKTYMGHYSDIDYWLKVYEPHFTNGGKMLIFTQQISIMKTLEDMCNKYPYLKPISIWSVNANEEMNEEQKKARLHLLDHGELIAPYNVLILNRATETGVNIIDKKMDVVIIDNTDKTQQTQSRNRIRHDIDLLVMKTKDYKQLEFSIDENLLNQWHTKEVIETFVIVKNNIRDKRGRQIGLKALPDELKKHGYIMESKRKTVDGRKVTIYKLSKL